MLAGYRTYITLGVMVLTEILKALGFVEFSNEQIETSVVIILSIFAFLFRYLATRNKK